MAQSEPGRVLAFTPQPAQLLALVRAAAADSSNVKFGMHALGRMEERGITTLDALRVLRQGEIEGPIQAGTNKGEWKCKL